MKHGELQDQLLLELITAKFRLLLQRSMYQWTENLSKSIIYTSRRLSRELFIFITKKKKKRIHRKGNQTARAEAWRARFPPRSALELITQILITSPAFNVSMKTCQNRLYENYQENYSILQRFFPTHSCKTSSRPKTLLLRRNTIRFFPKEGKFFEGSVTGAKRGSF